MNDLISIHELSLKFGLTSRTLRHWEDEGLFQSRRDIQSGWRVYDQEALKTIKFILILRELDISIKNIRLILKNDDIKMMISILEKQAEIFDKNAAYSIAKKNMLKKFIEIINLLGSNENRRMLMENIENYMQIQNFSVKKHMKNLEETIMHNNLRQTGNLKIISLPLMRTASFNVVSESPEDEALNRVITWAENENLMSTVRIFGYNTTPYEPQQKKYGWAACVTIPDNVKIPEYLEEKKLPGGLYASLESTNEVYDSWQKLTILLKENNEYSIDLTRPCLEEHIKSAENKGTINNFYITLLAAVKKQSNT
ncbi:MAG: MerR family transcriptional regulator [Candidatus Wallbacteria bacterium]